MILIHSSGGRCKISEVVDYHLQQLEGISKFKVVLMVQNFSPDESTCSHLLGYLLLISGYCFTAILLCLRQIGIVKLEVA